MRFEFTIVVWGGWHIDALERAMLPSLLAPGNLPHVVRAFPSTVRIITRAADRAAIDALPGVARLRALVATQVVVATQQQYVDAPTHHAWWRDAARHAAASGAFAVFLSPDHLWPDGSVFNFCRPLAAGARAVIAPPELRIVSETALPAVDALRKPNGVLSLSPRDAIALGMHHLHPLSGTALHGAPHGRPAIERLFPVGDAGFVMVKTAREVIAFDPNRCELSECALLTDSASAEGVYMSASSDDYAMLSLAPLTYEFALVANGAPADERSLAHWSTVPENDTPLNAEVARRTVRMTTGRLDEARWADVEAEAQRWIRRYLRLRAMYRIARELRRLGRRLAAGLLAFAAHTVELPDAAWEDRPLTLFVPDDAAIAALPPATLRALIAADGGPVLRAFLGAHVASYDRAGTPLPGGARVVQTLVFDTHRFHLIDQCLPSMI